MSDVNDAPVLSNNSMLVDEGSTGNSLQNSFLMASDNDDTSDQLTYTVLTTPGAGEIRLNGTELTSTMTFTQKDVDDGLVTYDHNGSETTSDTINLRLADGGEDGVAAQDFTFVVNVTPVNEAPQVTVNTVNINEGSTGNLITSSLLNAADVDVADTPGQLTYTLQNPPSEGVLRLNGVELNVGQTFTQLDVNDGNLTYDHSGGGNPTDQIEFELADGLEDSVTAQSVFLDLAINQVNDAPFDLSNGIEINEAGDNLYFHTSKAQDIFGGVEALTYEF